uniref:Uncharacterized protein n=1 Tax=Arundo donax TaxID=35708 RepID=A0A0A8Z9S0_ARUDO
MTETCLAPAKHHKALLFATVCSTIITLGLALLKTVVPVLPYLPSDQDDEGV